MLASPGAMENWADMVTREQTATDEYQLQGSGNTGSPPGDDMVISRDVEKRRLNKVYSGDESSSEEEGKDDMDKSQGGGSPRLGAHHE
jgi:hypothetical protein